MVVDLGQCNHPAAAAVRSGDSSLAESGPLHGALRAWAAALGDAHVEVSNPVLDAYGRTTGVSARRPLGVLRPECTEQVCQILRIASEFGIAVHPISRGKNWGYGDAAPPGNGQVTMDLGGMRRIIEVNAQLGYAVIEPGVTQGQLYDYLTENQLPLWMDATGAGRDASIVGNTLDRGFGHTRYGDRAQNTCGLEVVLADGRVLNTGFGHYASAKAHRTYRYGIGPSLDGLFTQSNFGVVTRMGIWLMPEPEAFNAFFVSAAEARSLPDLIDRLAPLRMQGLLQNTIHIANDLRALSGHMRYPWERAGGRTPLPDEVRAQLRRERGVGAWNACGAIYGTRRSVAAVRGALRRALTGYKLIFLDDRKLRTAKRIGRALEITGIAPQIAQRLRIAEPVYGLLRGIPTNEPLRGAAWRVRGAEPLTPADPLDCHAGLLWIAPTLSASGSEAAELMTIVEPIYHKYGFETLVTFTMITERAMCCVTNVAFDRREADEVSRAAACYEELTDLLMTRGYVLYRCGPGSMRKLADRSSVFWEVASELKAALDPNRVISPGRYEPLA